MDKRLSMSMETENTLTVAWEGEEYRAEAVALASHIGAPVSETRGEGLTLLRNADGLSLVGYGMTYRGDFEGMLPRIAGGRLFHEMLVHIAKTKEERPAAVDATAGMGEDSFLLAAYGYEVTLCERDPVIAALLADALRRAENHPILAPIIARMHLVEGDSIAYLQALSAPPDLVYLDPMFPERKKSGLIGKKLQLIQKLERPCGEEDALFAAAMAAHPKKLVVKRPLKGPELAGVKPEYSVKGKAIRYDCFRVVK